MANSQQAGSAAGAAIEGFLGGVQAGTNLRRQRTADQQTAEEIERRRVGEEVQRGREGVVDTQRAAAEARAAETHAIDIFNQGIRPIGVDGLRSDVGDAIGEGAPPGFERFAPSPGQVEEDRAIDLRQRTGEFLANPEGFDTSDQLNIEALEESGLLDDLLRQREAAERPDAVSPLQRVTGEGGREFTFDPRGDPGERVAPLMGPGGEQFISRQPADNFLRSNAQAAANAISRLDIQDFFGDAAELAAAQEQTAQRFGYNGVAEVQQTLRAAVSGGAGGGEGDDPAEVSTLLEQALASDELSEEEKQLAREFAEDPSLAGQRAAVLRQLLGIDAAPQ